MEEIMLGFRRSEYSITGIIRPVNIVDQDDQGSKTVTANQSNDGPKTGCRLRCASMESAVICSFEIPEAVSAGSRDPMDVDGTFLDDMSLNVF
jgi:hypothetical protein